MPDKSVDKTISDLNLYRVNTKEYYEDMKLNKGTLKQLVSGMKILLQPFQHDFTLHLEEDNGILSGIKFEVRIKNLK